MRTIVCTQARVSPLVTVAMLAGCGRIGFAPWDDGHPGSGSIDVGGVTGDTGPVDPIGIADDFEDGIRAAFWTNYSGVPPDTSASEMNGEYIITMADGNPSSYAGLGTFVQFDLTGHGMWLELAAEPPTTGGGMACYFGTLGIQMGSTSTGTLQIVLPNGEPTVLVPWDYSVMRWWRFREDGGFVLAETSGDGMTYIEHARIVAPPDVQAAGVNIGGGTFAAVPGGQQCRYESFNLQAF